MASALRGVFAGEEPGTGWRFAAAGAGIVLFALVLVNLVSLIPAPEAWIIDAYQWIVVIAYALGHLFLLTGFTLGLPSLDPVDEDDLAYTGYDEDNDDGFEETEADYEDGPLYHDESR
jgi:Na+/melibiose symporter-like transporter